MEARELGEVIQSVRPNQHASLLSWRTANVKTVILGPTGKVELHGKVIEVDYSVPKKLR